MRKPTTATKSYTALSSNRKNGKKMEKALGEKRLKRTTVHLKKYRGIFRGILSINYTIITFILGASVLYL